jgi:hypothetical protein
MTDLSVVYEITDYDNRSMAKYQTEVILGRYMTAILQEINQLIFILKAGKKGCQAEV